MQWLGLLYSTPEYVHVQIGAYTSEDLHDIHTSFLDSVVWSQLLIEPQPHVYQRLSNRVNAKIIKEGQAIKVSDCILFYYLK